MLFAATESQQHIFKQLLFVQYYLMSIVSNG